MANRVVNFPQSGSHKTILSFSPGQTKAQTTRKTHTKNNSCVNRAWDDEGAFTQVSSEVRCDV